MGSGKINLLEARDLIIYKKLMVLLGDYTDKFPATGLNNTFKILLNVGMQIIPKDKKAQSILQYVLNHKESVPAVVQNLLNLRFADLPIEYSPIYKNENAGKTVAFWGRDGKVHDKVISLLNLNLEKNEFWSNEKGEKVELIKLEGEL
jgi:hypothetical protein